MDTWSTLIFLCLALVGVSCVPFPKIEENVDSVDSDLLSSTYKGKDSSISTDDSKLAKCEKSCKVCDAIGKLQSDGSCKCYAENGGEVVCLHGLGTSTTDPTDRGERCSDELGSPTPGQLTIQARTAAERSLEEFRVRVEKLRELTLENLRKINLLASKPPVIEIPSLPKTDLTLGVPRTEVVLGVPKIEPPKLPSLGLPKIEVPKIATTFALPGPLPKLEPIKVPSLVLPKIDIPKLATTFTLPSTLPKLEPIKIPTLDLSRLQAKIPDIQTKFELPSLPKIDLKTPQLPSLPMSNLPVSPFLGKSSDGESQTTKEENEDKTEDVLAAVNPVELEKDSKEKEVIINEAPALSFRAQLPSLSMSGLNRRAFYPPRQMNFGIPQFSARFPPSILRDGERRISRASQLETVETAGTEETSKVHSEAAPDVEIAKTDLKTD